VPPPETTHLDEAIVSADPAAAGKQAAARAAADLLTAGMRVGLGTGSTMEFVLNEIAVRGLKIIGVPTSQHTAERARVLGIALTDLGATPELDIDIDGADEVETGTLNLIKGLGGALLREKIVAQAARRLVVVADQSKIVERLGTKALLPIEVVPFGNDATKRQIAALGLEPVLRHKADGTPFKTDNGNLIYDCRGLDRLDPPAIEPRLLHIAGVVETGLFLRVAERAIIGFAQGGSTELRPDGPPGGRHGGTRTT
jgi:ribose 5-phosphate isomerase A